MDREELLQLIKDLVKLPSVTESAEESLPAFFLQRRFQQLPYFKEHGDALTLIDTPLEGSKHELKALAAFVRADCGTNRTVLLISHFDVVSAECYGQLQPFAFDCDALGEKLGNKDENRLYGRGVMDMKAGSAINALLVEDFAKNTSLFDVNVLALFVGDEENSSAGARGVLPYAAELKKKYGLDYLCAIDTEPGEAGCTEQKSAMIYLGTLGKLMPAFYAHGVSEHVNACYKGFSAALAVAKIIARAECSAALADPAEDFCETSWICLDAKTMCDKYSVTLPDRAYAYFNCFVTNDTPETLLSKMKLTAANALKECSEQLERSCLQLRNTGYKGAAFVPPAARVMTLAELETAARNKAGTGFDSLMEEFINSLPAGDMRARGISIVDRLALLADIEEPYVVCFFLPPWLPARSDYNGGAREESVLSAARSLIKTAAEKYDTELKEIRWFAGLCDLSYTGAALSPEDAESYRNSLPGGDAIYKMPFDAMLQLGMPVANLGPSGENPHRKDEYLNLHYSIDILPQLLKEFIAELSLNVK